MGEQTGTRSDGHRLVVFGEELPKKARGLGIDLVPLGRSHQFDVQDGRPLPNVVYVGHPVRNGVLVPFADYDEQVARDKLQEALRVLNSLGAAEIVAKEERTNTSESRADGPLKVVNGRFNRKKMVQRKVAYEQHGTGSAPVDPRPLRYPGEPGLDSACEGVLVNGVKTLRIEIISESQFSVDGEIGVMLKKAGLKLGASVQKSELRTFLIQASFKGATLPKDDVAAMSEEARGPLKWFRND